MTNEVGSGTAGSQYLKNTYPVTEGLTAGTTKHPETDWFLEPEEDVVPDRDKKGI